MPYGIHAGTGRPGGALSPGLARLALALLLALVVTGPVRAFELEGALNLNTATEEELQQLPFVGVDRARAIVRYRREHGPFKSLDEVMRTKAVGQGTFAAIRPYLSLDGVSTLARVRPAAGLEVVTRTFTSPDEIVVLPDREYFETLCRYIREAGKSIDMTMFVFKVGRSPDNRPAAVLAELAAARRRGVKVFVVLEQSDYDEDLSRENRRAGTMLRRQGIEVAYDPQKTTTHAKLVVIDGRYSFVGSHNLTEAALSRNNELSLLIDNRDLARKLEDYVEGLRNED